MLKWSAVFFAIAIVAALFGFGGVAESAASISKILFGIFLTLFLLTFLLGAVVFKKK